ncbi:MAG TPA: hypothetical protein VKB56_00660 [Terriglobales bacterium]|nr:hypothetical protein [Terriglobales bacterium]
MVVLASDFDKSKYLRAEDLKAEKKLRIKEVTVEGMADKEQKLTVWFTNDKRGLVLNKTNNRTLRGEFGDDVSDWKDKIIVVFPTMVDFRGKMVPGLRVRIPPPKQAGQAAAAVPSQPKQGGNGQVAAATPPSQELDEFGQTQSPEKPSLAEDLDDEVNF